MNGNFQGGTHPDAEMLNGFAEQALGAREREQVLDHLVVCGRCREIVALAREASEAEGPAAAAAPARENPWFRNWRFAWAPALALAGVAALAVFVHLRHGAESEQVASVAHEEAAPPQAMVASPEPPAAVKAVASAPAEAVSASRKQGEAAKAENALVATREKTPAALSSTGSVSGIAGTAEISAAEAERNEPAAQMQASGGAAIRKRDANEATQAEMAAGSAQTLSAGAPAMEGASADKLTSRTMRAGPAAPAKALTATSAVRAVPLPSGLGTVSMAANGRWAVAIDSAGAVFASDDDGAHWQQAAKQWDGRAVRVRVQLERSNNAGKSAGTPEAKKGAEADALQSAGPVFEIANENNQTWTSTDGLIWTPR